MATGLPSSVSVAVEFTAGVWTDLSSRIGRLTITKGESQPGTLSFDLENTDGLVTPDYALGTYYPNFVEGKRIRVQVVKSATTYTRFVGRISQLEPVLGVSQGEDVVSVTATDMLGDLSRMKMRPLVQMLVASELIPSVQAIYPLTDPNGKRGVNDLLGEVQSLRVRSFGPLGSIEYNAVGELGPDGQRFVSVKGQKALEHKSSAIFILPSSASGNALTVAVRIPEEGSAKLLHLGRVSWTGFEPAQFVDVDYTGAESSGSGTNCVYVSTQDSSGALIDISGDVPVDPGWVIIQLKWVSGSLTMTLSNGNSATISDTNTSAYTRLALGNLIDTLGGTVPEYDGSYGYAIVNTGGAIEEMANALLGDNDTYPYTITEALTLFSSAARLSDLGATVAVSSSPVTVREFAAIPYLDRTALEVLLDIASSESGIVYHTYSSSATQTITILSRDQSRSSTVALTLDAEQDLAGAPVYSRGVLDVVSQATVSNSERDVTVTDNTRTSVVGAASASLQTVMDGVYELLALGQAELARSNAAALRISSVTLDLMTAQNDLYASAFAVNEGSRLRVTNLPTARVGAPYLDGYVSTQQEEITTDSYTITYGLLPTDAPPEAKFDDSTYGRFGFGDGICTVTGGTAVGTTSTGTITLTWTGSSTISTSAGDYPMDFDWNGERVTVTTAASGSTSPRTLTITARGVGNTTARVHSAGEAIDIWGSARFAY